MDPERIIEALSMQPHPEGGHYVETFRDLPADGGRGALTCVYFLLRRGERSHWHRIDATEVWHHQAGDALELSLWREGGAIERQRIGPDVLRGEQGHVVVPVRTWQSARPLGAFALVSCTVAPAFVFEGFELAPKGWEPQEQA